MVTPGELPKNAAMEWMGASASQGRAGDGKGYAAGFSYFCTPLLIATIVLLSFMPAKWDPGLCELCGGKQYNAIRGMEL